MPSFRNSVGLFVGQGLAPAENILKNYNLKNGLNIEFKPFFGTFCLLLGGVNCAQAQETRDSKFGDIKEQQIWKKQFGELFRSE